MEVLLFEFCIVLLPPSPGSTDEPKGGIVPPSLALYIVPCSTVDPLPRVALYLVPLYHEGGRWRRSEFKWLRNT